MTIPVSELLPRVPEPDSVLFGAPIRPETVQRLAGALTHLTARRTARVVTHVIQHPHVDLLHESCEGNSNVYTRFTLGPCVGTVVVGLRYQASRPKDGVSEAEIVMLLRRVPDDDAIDTVTLGAADIVTDPAPNEAGFPPRWLWLPIEPVAGPRALDAAGWAGTTAELAMSTTDVRVLTVVVIEIQRSEVG